MEKPQFYTSLTQQTSHPKLFGYKDHQAYHLKKKKKKKTEKEKEEEEEEEEEKKKKKKKKKEKGIRDCYFSFLWLSTKLCTLLTLDRFSLSIYFLPGSTLPSLLCI